MRSRFELALIILLHFIFIIFVSVISAFLTTVISSYHFHIFFWSCLFLLFGYGVSKVFDIPFRMFPKQKKMQTYLIPLLVGIVAGGWFYFIREPLPPLKTVWVVLLDPLVVALAEEVNYRGVLLNAAKGVFTKRTAIILQAGFFAFVHFNFSLVFLFSYLVFGIVAGTVAEKHSLSHAIVLHFVTNAVLFWCVYLGV